MAEKIQREMVNVMEAARILGLSHWTIRSWCYSGKIASHKLGTRLLVDRAELDRVISESERPRMATPAPSVYETRGPLVMWSERD